MGQKVNPKGLRVGVIKDWDSKWYAKSKDFGELLLEDNKIRKYVKESLFYCPNIIVIKSLNIINKHKTPLNIHTLIAGI